MDEDPSDIILDRAFGYAKSSLRLAGLEDGERAHNEVEPLSEGLRPLLDEDGKTTVLETIAEHPVDQETGCNRCSERHAKEPRE